MIRNVAEFSGDIMRKIESRSNYAISGARPAEADPAGKN
jgi:hypothetical protein